MHTSIWSASILKLWFYVAIDYRYHFLFYSLKLSNEGLYLMFFLTS